MLGPDLRVLILLEYPGVSPRGSRDKAMVKGRGGPKACLRSGSNKRDIPNDRSIDRHKAI